MRSFSALRALEIFQSLIFGCCNIGCCFEKKEGNVWESPDTYYTLCASGGQRFSHSAKLTWTNETTQSKKIKMAPSSLVLAATDFILRAAACWRVYRPSRGRNIRFGQRRGGQIDNQPTRPPRWKYIRGFLLFGILCSGRWFSCWQHRVFPGVATSFPPTQSNRTWAKIAWAPSADQPPASAPDLPPKVPHPRPSLPTYRTTQIRLPWPRQQAATALSEWFNVHNFKALANSTS